MSYLVKRIIFLPSCLLTLLALLPATADSAQQWQGQRGQIAVAWPLILSNNPSPREGAVNMLLRWGEGEQRTPFAQWGFNRYPNGRTLNVGFGQRWQSVSDTLWGLNLFYDYQLKEHHQRLSIGAEVQRDYLKLAANGYLPLSGRRTLNNTITDAVRSAWGIDAHIDAYLPHYPWIGLRVMGEYYAGIAGMVLDPQGFQKLHYPAVTLGFNYTPIPLFKISYDYTIGKKNTRDHRVTLQLTYRFNFPSSKQLRADQVGRLRACQNSQLDLVSRNPRIVLNKTTRPIASNFSDGNQSSGNPGKNNLSGGNQSSGNPGKNNLSDGNQSSGNPGKNNLSDGNQSSGNPGKNNLSDGNTATSWKTTQLSEIEKKRIEHQNLLSDMRKKHPENTDIPEHENTLKQFCDKLISATETGRSIDIDDVFYRGFSELRKEAMN